MTTHTPSAAPSRTARILVVDDERSMRDLLEIALKREGYEVLVADGGRSAVDVLKREAVDLLVSDVKMPDMNGVEVLKAAKEIDREIVGIMITAYASTDSAVKALNMGAHDYLSKPFNVDELKKVVRNALEHRQLREENAALKRTLRTSSSFSNIIGQSDPMTEVFHLVDRVAPTNSTVLITGESGTGKELVARAIHINSLRQNRPFVAVNCGALPETLLESELFGHMRGAFTGADSNKKGLVEVADRGTIFLDEIGEMSLLMQVKLLRVLQERTFRRVGGTSEVHADIRVIAATNRDLGSLVSSGQFREDLFYRINVISVHLPPLRERVEDIPLLAETFVRKFAKSRWPSQFRVCRAGPCGPCGPTNGPATCGSSRTPWSVPWPSSRRRPSRPTACNCGLRMRVSPATRRRRTGPMAMGLRSRTASTSSSTSSRLSATTLPKPSSAPVASR